MCPTFRSVFFLITLLAGLVIASRAEDSLRYARESLLDHRPDLAEAYARAVVQDANISEERRYEALEIIVQSYLARNTPSELLQFLENAPGLPPDERPALWKAAALAQQQSLSEAIDALRAAIPTAETNIVLELRRNLAPLLVANGAPQEALCIYAELRDESSGVTAVSNSLERARIYTAQRDFEAVLRELAPPPDAASMPELLPAFRALRSMALLQLDQTAQALDLFRESITDKTPDNAPYRPAAALQAALLLAKTPDSEALAFASLAAALDPGSETEFRALQLSAQIHFTQGQNALATPFLEKALLHPLATPAFRSQFCLQCAFSVPAHAPAIALELCDRILQADPGVFDASPLVEANAYTVRGERLLAATPPNPSAASRDFSRAAELYASLQRPILRDKAAYQAASAALSAGNTPYALTLFQSIAATTNSLPDNDPLNFRPLAAAHYAQVLEESDPAHCEAAYRAIATDFPAATNAIRFAALHLAAWQFNAGHYETAATNYWVAANTPELADDPNLRCNALINAGLAASRCFSFADAARFFEMAQDTHATNAVQATCLRAFALHEWGGYESTATNLCASVIADNPESPWAAEAALWLAIFNDNKNAFDATTNLLHFVTQNHSSHPKAPAALHIYIQTLLKRDDSLRLASQKAAQFVETYPNDPLLPEVLLLQGDILRHQFSFEEASIVFNHIAQQWPATDVANRALFRHGICLFSLASQNPTRYTAAEACFRSLLDSRLPLSPDISMEVYYRIARCQEAKGEKAQAMDTYYQGVILPFRNRSPQSPWTEKTIELFSDASKRTADLAESPAVDKPDFAKSIREDFFQRFPENSPPPTPPTL